MVVVAGGAYLVELAASTPSAANIKAYAEIVRDKAIQRKLIDVGTAIVNDGFQPEGRESGELLAKAEQAVFAIAEGHSRGKQDFVPVKNALRDAFEVLQRRNGYSGYGAANVAVRLAAMAKARSGGLRHAKL